MAKKITETGPQQLKGIRNPDLYPTTLNASPINISDEEMQTINDLYARSAYSNYDAAHGHMGYDALRDPMTYEGVEREDLGNFGQSQYDENVLYGDVTSEDIQNIRYENQPWYDTLANGLGKMLGTAATTFVSSLVGLPYGIGAAINEGRWSALWDNEVTQGLADVNNWLEENMTNYRSTEQQNSPWYDPSNLFSMNFIADDIIKNMGFTIGAASSMMVGSGGLGLMSKALGFTNEVSKAGKVTNNVLSALFSATGEGMIEAKQGVDERNKLELQRLNDALAPEYEALNLQQQEIDQQYAITGDYNTYKQQMQDLMSQREALDNRKAAGQQQIEESGQRMGNAILLANQGLLTMGNLIQFSKGMTKSFDRARHAAETSNKAVRPFGVKAKRVSDNLADGYKIVGKTFGKSIIAPKNILKEGAEEMNQQWVQSSSGAAYNEEDVNDYWKAKLDPESYRETTKGLYTIGNILDKGFQESWGDLNQWEQFVIGGLTGMSGSYAPTKIFNQDKTKSKWNPMRYGSWEGGMRNELNEFNQQYQQFEENIDDVNKILQSEDFPARVRDMVGHTYTESQKADAADSNSMKDWKDADDKQFVHDIQAFLRAGKLDDLRAIYNEIGTDLSDDDIEGIIKSTTKEITAEEDKQNFDRNIDEQIAEHQRTVTELNDQAAELTSNGVTPEDPQITSILSNIEKENTAIADLHQQKQDYVGQKYFIGTYVDKQGNRVVTNDEVRDTIKHNAEELNRKLDSYLDSIDYVNKRTNGVLTKDQEDNLAYLHNLGKESDVRMRKIMSNVRQRLPSKFLLKTTKTPEQLTQEYASSDLTFSKDENTKEGYVEVDTSLMNNNAFADFFQREIMRGGNINPEFAETADEKVAREEEEKTLSDEEKKQKVKERASKKWKDAIQKMQDDANEQWDTNWRNLVDNFFENYKKNNNATLDETVQAFQKVKQDLQDASNLYDQAGEFQRTLMEYMQNPSLVDRDKEKAENKAQKAAVEQQAKNQFVGKDAKQLKQEVASGNLNIDDFEGFAGADLSDVTDDDVKSAQQEVKKAQEGNQKAAALKNHIQESLGNNPTQQELNDAQVAMQMVDAANLATNDPSEISIDMPELSQVPLDQIDPNASIEYVDTMNMNVQQMLADAFNAYEEDKNAQDDIPEEVPANAVSDVETPETGKDSVPKTKPEIASPKKPNGEPSGVSATENDKPVDISESYSPSKAEEVIPKNPLTEGAIDTIVGETQKLYEKPSTNGTWRSTTTRYIYGRSTGTYHEDIAKQQYGEDSKEYKRSKAIWEYLNNIGAFDRQENSSNDRIKEGDTVHFMVKNFAKEMYGKDFGECSDEEKLYSLVTLMVTDNGEVIGDLPLAELEPTYKAGTPTQQVKDLKSLQDRLFNKYTGNYEMQGSNEAIADSVLKMDGRDNLNLTFDNAKKTPLVSKVKQTMKGVVPYRKAERHTLNEIANSQPFELGVAVTGSTIAKKRGDKSQHNEIVKPNVGTTGQPYLLLPTPSGEQIAVPFYMVPFNAEQHKGTELYKLLSNAVYYILANNSYSTAEQKNYFNKHSDVLEGLLQVKRQEKVRTVEAGKDSVTLHLQSLANPEQKINLTVSNAGTLAEVATRLVDAMSGIPINVSLQFLNDRIETGIAANEKYTRSYNQVIGEIADINLPQNTTHTVNGWFTVELAPSAGIKPSKKVTPRTTGVHTEVIGGRNVEIDTDRLIAVDTATGEVIVDDEEINLMLAQIKANKPQYQGKERIQISINGELKTYDVKENKFVKQREPKAETTKEGPNSGDVSAIAGEAVAFSDTPAGEAAETTATGEAGVVQQPNVQRKIVKPNIFKASKNFLGEKISSWRYYTESDKNVDEYTGNITGGTLTNVLKPVIDFAIASGILGEEYRLSTQEDGRTVESQKKENSDKARAAVKELYSLGIRNPQQLIEYVEQHEGEVIGEPATGETVTKQQPTGQQPTKNNAIISSNKSIQDVENEAKQNKIVGRQSKDAWTAIPDDLKLRMFNDGAALQLSYNGKNVVVSTDNMPEFTKTLVDANMAAKAGNLTVTEVAKPMEKSIRATTIENEQAARRWLAKNLPSLSSEERTQFVDKLVRVGNDGGKYWGSYRSGVIQIDRNAPQGAVYHEAFHYVLDMILSPEERKAILDTAREEYKVDDNWVAEEKLAEDFRRYSIDANVEGITGKLRRWFRTIKDKITRYNRISDATINQLFWKINNGEFAQRSTQAESFEENQQRVLREIRNVQKEKYSWKNLSGETKEALTSSGLSEATYDKMSLEEKEQYVKCRG